jgi:hypothetical protein
MSRVLGVLVVFSLGVASAWGIRYLKTQNSLRTSPTPLVQADTTPIPQTAIPKKFAQPRFGNIAVNDCRERCSTTSANKQDACRRSCNRLLLRSYGRRITLEPLNPDSDADKLIKSCTQRDISLDEHLVSSDWEEETLSALELLKEVGSRKEILNLGSARDQLLKLLSISNESKFPPGGTEAEIQLSKSLVRSSCLFVHLTLSEMGIQTAKANSDSFSERYYVKMRRKLLNSARESESPLFTQASSFPSFEGL